MSSMYCWLIEILPKILILIYLHLLNSTIPSILYIFNLLYVPLYNSSKNWTTVLFLVSLFYIFKINCIFILITFYFKILVYCTSNFVPICILESYRVLSVCITWYSFNLFFMLRNNFDHLYDFCVCHEDALIYNITPTHQYILFSVTSWMVHWSLALGFHTDSIIIKKKTLMIGDCLRGDFLPWQENHMKFMLHL